MIISTPPHRQAPILAQDGKTSSAWMFRWMQDIFNVIRPGVSVTIVTAKLTTGGANGSMTFKNGVLVAQTPAT